MAQSLALPTFISGPRDNLAAADVYKVNNTDTINSIQNILQKYDPKLTQSLGGMNRLDVNSLTKSILGMGTSTLDSNKKGLLDRVLGTSPTLNSLIRSMDSEVKNVFDKAVGSFMPAGKAGSMLGGAQSLVGGVTNTIKPYDALSQRELGSLIQSVTGSDVMKVTDTGANAGLFGGLMKTAMNSGVGGAVQEVFSVITDRQVMGMLVREIPPTIITTSSARDLYGLATSVATGNLLGAVPMLLTMFSKDYKFGATNYNYSNSYQGSSNHIKSYAEIIRAFRAVDPTWDHYVRKTEVGDDVCTKIAPMVGASEAFLSVLKAGVRASTVPSEKPLMLATVFKNVSVQDSLKTMYPKAAFNFDNSVTKTVDARSLFT